MVSTLKALAFVGLLILLAACGSSNNSSSTQLRFVDATSSTLNVTANGTSQFSNVSSGTATGYATVSTGSYTVTVSSPSASLTSSTQTFGIGSGQSYSLLAYERDGAINVSLIAEDETVPATGYGTLGAINLSSDSGSLDLYIVPAGTTSINLLSPSFSGLQGGSSTVFQNEPAATYDMIATAAGNVQDVRFKASGVALANGQNLSLALTGSPGGALVNGVLLVQGGSANFIKNANARARVVSALPPTGSYLVAATVGGTALPSVFAPNAAPYTLVPGGSSTYTITVCTTTAVPGLPSATFATGGDFTILVYGTTSNACSTPSVSVFSDNNQLPPAGDVNLRLVNAATSASGAGGLTLYDNGVQVASSIPYGAASGYFGVAVSSSSNLELIVPSLAPVNVPASLTTPGAVFTIFVVDSGNASPAPPITAYLIRDR